MWSAKNLPRHTTIWSADEIDLLGKLLLKEVPVSEIAKRLGRSQEAVRSKASQLGILPTRSRRRNVGLSDGPRSAAGATNRAGGSFTDAV